MRDLSARLLYLALGTVCAVAVAGGYVAAPQPLARSLSEEQVDNVVRNAPADANVGLPGWYAKQAAAYRDLGTNALAKAAVPALGAVIADSRRNIPELSGLTDVQIADLYLRQMSKPADELAALSHTNSLEYLIGAGMRADLRAMEVQP